MLKVKPGLWWGCGFVLLVLGGGGFFPGFEIVAVVGAVVAVAGLRGRKKT